MNATGFLVLGGAGLAAVNSFAHGHLPKARIFLGAAIGGAGLLALGEKYPEIAQSFAALFFVTSLLVNGAGVATATANALGGATTK